MAIQIPSGAGFVPQESVLDGITKLFQTFSPDAKNLRKAQIGQINAQSNLANTEANYIPDTHAQQWDASSHDLIRANATRELAKNNSTETGLDVENNPLKQTTMLSDAAARIGQVANEAQSVANQSQMVPENIANLHSEMQNRQAQIDQNKKLLDLETNKNSDNAAKINSEIQNQKNEMLFRLYQMTPDDNPQHKQIRNDYQYQILKGVSPDAAKEMIDLATNQHRAQGDYNPRLNRGQINKTFQQINGGSATGEVVRPPVPTPFTNRPGTIQLNP